MAPKLWSGSIDSKASRPSRFCRTALSFLKTRSEVVEEAGGVKNIPTMIIKIGKCVLEVFQYINGNSSDNTLSVIKYKWNSSKTRPPKFSRSGRPIGAEGLPKLSRWLTEDEAEEEALIPANNWSPFAPSACAPFPYYELRFSTIFLPSRAHL